MNSKSLGTFPSLIAIKIEMGDVVKAITLNRMLKLRELINQCKRTGESTLELTRVITLLCPDTDNDGQLTEALQYNHEQAKVKLEKVVKRLSEKYYDERRRNNLAPFAKAIDSLVDGIVLTSAV